MTSRESPPRLAIVVSWLNQYGGAERVLEVLHEMYPEAPILTSMYEPKAMPETYRSWDIRVSYMDRLPFTKRSHQLFLPLYPLAFESLDLTGFDVVLSVPSAFAHGVITTPETLHICYCLTPARFLWNYEQYVEREKVGALIRWLLPHLIRRLRRWDRSAANRVDHFIAISRVIQRRITNCYDRNSTIIYPPVNTSAFRPANSLEDYFLVVSRLVPYKRIDIVVRAFNQLGLPLVVIGGGRDRPSLEAMARSNIRFLGQVSDEELRHYMAACRGFLFPGEEDFGITPIEAMATGRPVIAYAGGGALETVIEGKTGVFFAEHTPESLAEVMRTFDHRAFDPDFIRRHATTFDREVFSSRISTLINEKWAERQGQCST